MVVGAGAGAARLPCAVTVGGRGGVDGDGRGVVDGAGRVVDDVVGRVVVLDVVVDGGVVVLDVVGGGVVDVVICSSNPKTTSAAFLVARHQERNWRRIFRIFFSYAEVAGPEDHSAGDTHASMRSDLAPNHDGAFSMKPPPSLSSNNSQQNQRPPGPRPPGPEITDCAFLPNANSPH